MSAECWPDNDYEMMGEPIIGIVFCTKCGAMLPQGMEQVHTEWHYPLLEVQVDPGTEYLRTLDARSNPDPFVS